MIELSKSLAEWLLPLLASAVLGIGGLVLYFLKRKIERKHNFENLELYSKSIDLYDKLNKSGLDEQKLHQFTYKMNNFNQRKEIEINIIRETTNESSDYYGKIITQSDMNEMAAAELDIADAKLKSSILKLKTHLDLQDVFEFDKVQLKWYDFAKSQALFAAIPVKSGSMHSLMYCSSLTNLILERTSYIINETNIMEKCDL
jgi:Lysozyme inhibitor LprI